MIAFVGPVEGLLRPTGHLCDPDWEWLGDVQDALTAVRPVSIAHLWRGLHRRGCAGPGRLDALAPGDGEAGIKSCGLQDQEQLLHGDAPFHPPWGQRCLQRLGCHRRDGESGLL